MVVMEGVLSLCRVTMALFGRLPGVPEGLQVFSVCQVHSWLVGCLFRSCANNTMLGFCFWLDVM